MADDVKVKFGGDFSDVPKGAEAAANAAGTAMRGYFNTYAKGLKDKLASAFSMESLVGGFLERVNAQLEQFKEIDTLSRKLGVSREELQKFTKIGKEFNLDMETMGRSIQFANKTLGAAAMGNKEAQKKLLELGFTQKEVNSQHIKATDVLSKLSEEYEKNVKVKGKDAANTIVAKQVTDLFGRAGSDLIPILKEGNEELKKRISLLQVYSDSEVKAGAAAARAKERAEARFNKTIIGRFIGGATGLTDENALFGYFGEGGIMEGALKKSGFKSRSDVKTMEDTKKLSENFVKLAQSEDYTPEDLVRIFQAHLNTSVGMTSGNKNVLENMQMLFSNLAHQSDVNEAKSNKSEAQATPKEISALAASSLQQIGGGDITSVMSGLANNDVSSNIARTADATERMANKEAPKPGPQTLR
jgi:hypothetical protein